MQTTISSDLIDMIRLFSIDKRLSNEEINSIFKSEISQKIAVPKDSVPVSVFNNNKLSALETIVKYLKEEKALNFSKIAEIIGRSSKTIWATYNISAKKMPERLDFTLPSIHVPLNILKDRNLGVQESIVRYLKEKEGLSFHKIAVLLERDDRTIWTAYSRAVKKHQEKEIR